MIMVMNLMIMITIIIVMTIEYDEHDKSPLQGHGKEGENGDAHGEAGGEGVEAAMSFFKSY